MRNLKLWLGLSAAMLAVIVAILLLSPARMMEENVFTPLVKGYDFLGQGNYEAAQKEFRRAAAYDPTNPFALNNLEPCGDGADEASRPDRGVPGPVCRDSNAGESGTGCAP